MHSARHFLVKRIGEAYQLREIDSLLAHSLLWSGAFPWRTCSDQSTCYWFYFVHTPLPQTQAERILETLMACVQQEKTV